LLEPGFGTGAAGGLKNGETLKSADANREARFDARFGVKDSARMSLLFDYYGRLLSARHQTVFSLYHENNYSLGEIADELGISKQGVHDALKKAESALDRYEAGLGLISKHESYLKALKSVEETTARIASDAAIASISVKRDEERIRRLLAKIEKTIGDLDV
jgi:predicted DNA-binding protein YlxM (UPF0122 family)